VAGDVRTAYTVVAADTGVSGPNYYQDITVPGVTWTPKTFVIDLLDVTAVDTATNQISYCAGAGDGTTFGCTQYITGNNTSTTLAQRSATEDINAVLVYATPGSPATTQFIGVFNSFVTGGVRLQWLNGSQDPAAPTSAFLLRLTIYGGDDYNGSVHPELMPAAIGNDLVVSTPHKVTAVEAFSCVRNFRVVSNYTPWAIHSYGVAVHESGTTIKQWCMGSTIIENLSNLSSRNFQATNRLAGYANTSLSSGNQVELTAFGAITDFTVTAQVGSGSSFGVLFLAHDFSDREVSSGQIATPTNTGSDMGETSLGWEPQLLKMGGTLESDSGNQFANVEQAAPNYWVTDGVTIHGYALASAYLSSNNLTRSKVNDSFTLTWHDGATDSDIFELSTPTFSSSGWNSAAPHTTVNGTVRYWHWWAVEALDETGGPGDATIASTIGDLSTVAFDATQAVGDVTIGGTIGDLSTVAFDATQAVGDVTIGGTIGDLSTVAFNASVPTEDGVSLELATTVVDSLRTSLQGGAFALYAGDPESAGVELVSGGIPGSITAASDGAISFTPAASHAVGISESQTPTHWQITGNVGAGSPTWSGAFGDAFTSEDIADGGLVTFGEVTIAVSDLAGTPDPEPGETGTWESRSAGAHFATRWDVQADVDASYAQTFTENISLETRARFSGAGALRMAIPNDDGPGFGAWISPLFPDEASRAMQLGEELYISMAVYTPRDLLQQDFGGTFTGFKNMIVSNIDTSNPVFELVLQNTWSGGVVRGYHQDGVASAVNWESDVPEGVVSTAFTGSDRNWQPSRDAGANPLTGNSPDGDAWTQQEQDRARYAGLFGTQTDYRDVASPDPLTNAVLYQPDDWVHILQRIKIDDVDETSCEWQVWAWHEGLDGWQELVNIPDATLGAGATDTDGTGLNGTWITFYMTGVNPDAGRRNTYAVVDEYIVSPTAIAAPASAGRPAQIAAHGLRPATWSDAVSVTDMESSWTDASGFDSSVFLTGLYWEKYRRAAYTIGGVSGGQGGEFYLIRYDDETGTWSKHLQGTDPRTDQPNWKAHGWSNMCLDEERQRLLMANRRWLGTGNGYVGTIDLHYWDLTVADFDATYGTDTAINGAPTLMQATAITSSLTPYMCFEMQQYADKLVLYNPFGSGTCYHFDAADGANQTSLGTAPVALGLEPISAWERATDRVFFIGGATGGKSCFAVNDDGTYDNTIPDVPCTQSTLQCGGTQHDDAFSHPATGELVVYASIDREYYVLRGGVWGTLPNNDAPAVVDAGGTGNPSRSILHCPTPYGQGTALVAITRAGFETRMLRLPIEEP
jgi:hypothetical protein